MTFSITLAKRVGLCLAVAWLGACSATPPFAPAAPPPPLPQRPTAQLAPFELRHSVLFATNDDRLTPAEAAALDEFVAVLDQRLVVDQIVLGHADIRADDALNDALSARRAARVEEVLIERGIPPERISSAALGRRFPVEAPDAAESLRLSRRVEILVSGVVVVEPACPDWSRSVSHDGTNQPMSNLGCATEVNFLRMVADPADLVAPRPLGAADPVREVGAVQRYRQDKVRSLNVEEVGP
ncbi:MAG: CpaD family pilus assembly lipoprotein [Geminicoccaceae bacterium]